ncbi:MAG: hypothetical protein CL424_17855 [Acidimicrobiaceae bacterium]|nr:hypothetical protein [Acidimicrobiaceae bacterium]
MKDTRTEITSEWLADAAGVPGDLAQAFHVAFFELVENHIRGGHVLVLPGSAHGPKELVAKLLELESDDDDSPELWELDGTALGRQIRVRRGVEVFTLSDLWPTLERWTELAGDGEPVGEEQFAELVFTMSDRIADSTTELRFALDRSELEAQIESWALSRIDDLGHALSVNGLELVRTRDGRSGAQFRFANRRRADVIGRSVGSSRLVPADAWVVVEFKAIVGAREDVDQLADYMELVRSQLAGEDEAVVGFLVADGFLPDVQEYADGLGVHLQTVAATGFYEYRFLDRVGHADRFPSGGYWDMQKTLRKAGLPEVPLPPTLRSQVRRLDDWFWATVDLPRAALYPVANKRAGIPERPSSDDEPWFAFGHVGRGAQSWFLAYHLAYNGQEIHRSSPWARMYGSQDSEVERAAAMFDELREAIADLG